MIRFDVFNDAPLPSWGWRSLVKAICKFILDKEISV